MVIMFKLQLDYHMICIPVSIYHCLQGHDSHCVLCVHLSVVLLKAKLRPGPFLIYSRLLEMGGNVLTKMVVVFMGLRIRRDFILVVTFLF